MPNFVILTKIEGLLRVKISVAAERVNWIANGVEGSILNIGGESFPVEESKDEVLALLSRATQWVPRIVPLAVVGSPEDATEPQLSPTEEIGRLRAAMASALEALRDSKPHICQGNALACEFLYQALEKKE